MVATACNVADSSTVVSPGEPHRAETTRGERGASKVENAQDEPFRRLNMLWTIVVILLILWLLGFSFHIAGGLVHILLVIALVVVVINLLSGRRAV